MRSFSVEVLIEAPVRRVWRALCDPTEVARWDAGVERALDAPRDYPRPGQHVRWRCRSGLFRLLHDRPVEVETERLLRSRLALGPYRYDETYTLEASDRGCRLRADLTATLAVPFAGMVSLLYSGPITPRSFADSMDGLKHWCEAEASV